MVSLLSCDPKIARLITVILSSSNRLPLQVVKNAQGIGCENWVRLVIVMKQLTEGKTTAADQHLPPTLDPATWVLYDVWRRFKAELRSQVTRISTGKILLEALQMAFRGRAGGDDGSVIPPDELFRRLEAVTDRAGCLKGAAREDFMYTDHPGFLSTSAVMDPRGVFGPVDVPRSPRCIRRRAAAPLLKPEEPPISIEELEQALEIVSRAQAAAFSTACLLGKLPPPSYIARCLPALVFEATGALQWSLEPIGRTIFSSLVGVRFFCVDKLDWAGAVSGGDCPTPEEVASYHDLPKPYIVLLARSEAVKAAGKKPGFMGQRLEFGPEPYVPILAALDPPLTPQTADLLAAMNEVVSAEMGQRISHSTTSVGRHDVRVAPAAAYAHLRPDLRPQHQPQPLKGMLPPVPGMYASMFRYSRQGNSVGPRVVKGEPQDQQAACAVALVDRESAEIIMPHMRPAVALLAGRAAPSGIGITVGGLSVACKLVTLGGWGNQVHTDDTDEGGQAFIIMYARGDLARIRGGWFLLPGCRLRTTPGCPTLYYVASSLILHNTVPHTASEHARIVGTSLHMNRNLRINFAAAVGSPEGNGATEGAESMLRIGREEHISPETKEKYPVVRETLKKVVKKRTARHGDRWG